jgi:hypothetical protein
LRPGFYVLQRKLAVNPPAYYDLEHPLKTLAFLFRSVCILKCSVQVADPGIFQDKVWDAPPQHILSLIFVEFLHYGQLGKPNSQPFMAIGHEFRRVDLPDARSGADAVKHDISRCPILAEQAGLSLADGGELIVVGL